ncbi:beta-eliminating lyase-related protein [Actinoplanes sp. NPDC051470]|uniref:threonine aldolase family protein n=1 Tax=Actinoplanes sp. NPDC051470 TaxID=3157224 RepID=UPI003418053B
MDDEITLRRAHCTDSFHGNGLQRPADLLRSIPPDTIEDVYGDGGAVTDLEHHVAGLLGKPAAVFLPSGTMAQPAMLRVHADRRTTRTVVWHPYCHVQEHENGAYARLHQLVGRPAGAREKVLTSGDLNGVAEPVAALVLELPQRDLGGQLPAWDELVAQTAWAQNRGAAAHLDGARLWEASAGYGRPAAEIAALFDTVYVSFYKGVGALSGCCLAGREQDMAEVREWRHRLGGTLYGLWPAAASALNLLPGALAEMPARMEHARAIAAALAEAPTVRVVPDPPHTPMMHLLLDTTLEAYTARAKQLADEQRFWVWPRAEPTGDPDVIRTELSVGSATLRHKPSFIAETLAWLTSS